MDNSIELLAAQRLAETGLSAAELLSMDMAEYAARDGRPTPTQAALQALDAQYEPPGNPRQEPAPTQTAPQAPAPEPQGIDVSAMDMATYAQLRGQLGVGGREYGRGIFDGGGTAEWVAGGPGEGRASRLAGRGTSRGPPARAARTSSRSAPGVQVSRRSGSPRRASRSAPDRQQVYRTTEAKE